MAFAERFGNAAGQLVEEVTKSVRRGENVNHFYIRSLYTDVTSLYRLDQIASKTAEEEFGPLPVPAVVLLSVLAACWVAIGLYWAATRAKQKKMEKPL